MLRTLIVIAAVLCSAHASAQNPAFNAVPACPSGAPSPDGSEISSGSSCTAHDAAQNAWAFANSTKPNSTITMNDKPAIAGGLTGLGANAVDGSGNRFFATYAAASPKPYPFLPAPQ